MTYQSDRAGGDNTYCSTLATEIVSESSGAIRTGNPLPDFLRIQFLLGGLDQGSAFISPLGLDLASTTATNVEFNFCGLGGGLVSGLYPYQAIISTVYERSSFNSSFSDTVEGELLVIADNHSPFGAGWMLNRVSRLLFSSTGAVVWIDPQGDHSIFRPDGQGSFISPPTEFSQLVKKRRG